MNRALLVDDDPDFVRLTEMTLRRFGYESHASATVEDALVALAEDDFDVVLADVHLDGGESGIDLCRRVAERWENLPVVVMTAQSTVETAIAAIRAGAYDFVVKPTAPDALQVALDRAVRHRRVSDEVQRLRRAVRETKAFEDIIGVSAAMKRVFDLVDRAAESEASVLITGESGTGKELVARALHRRSARSKRPFIPISCAAMPESLLESELFGHVKGAFTDARTPRSGLLAQAAGGTLFLDEIGDMPLPLQPKLLRALQERTYRPVGGNEEIAFDVRILAATNRDLEEAVENQTFRKDVYFRLNVVRVHLPPLRSRGNDVLLIAQALLERHAALSGRTVRGISSAVARKLLAYPWPGNVRELANCIERAVTLTRGEELVLDDLPDTVRSAASEPSRGAGVDLIPLDDVERAHILHVLQAVGGNKTLAAKILGLDRKTLYRKLERYEVENTHAAATA
jgi:two-component system response regulator HydG